MRVESYGSQVKYLSSEYGLDEKNIYEAYEKKQDELYLLFNRTASVRSERTIMVTVIGLTAFISTFSMNIFAAAGALPVLIAVLRTTSKERKNMLAELEKEIGTLVPPAPAPQA